MAEEAGEKQVAVFPVLPVVLAVLTSYGLLALLVLSLRSWLSNRGESIASCWPGRAGCHASPFSGRNTPTSTTGHHSVYTIEERRNLES